MRKDEPNAVNSTPTSQITPPHHINRQQQQRPHQQQSHLESRVLWFYPRTWDLTIENNRTIRAKEVKIAEILLTNHRPILIAGRSSLFE
ncbi:hypothetical protein U1Q18_027517 [Sarracenia purpurea var. burkii]